MVIEHVLIFIISIILLVESSDFLVEAAARIAKKIGLSEFFIGLTLVAVGTSVPELINSLYAAFRGHTAIAVGNVIGSNITNISLILGVAALIATRFNITETMLKRDIYVLQFACMVFFLFALISILPLYRGDFLISPSEGVILLALFFAYILFLFEKKTVEEKKYHFKEFLNYFMSFEYITTIRRNIFKLRRKKKIRKAAYIQREALFKDFLIIAIAAVGVFYGAKYLINETIWSARFFNIPESLIAMTVIAFGTTLPEFSVTISAARKRLGNIAIGNIIGSNITNLLLIAGLASLVSPLKVAKPVLYFAIPFMIFVTFLLLYFVKSNWELRRKEGVVLLLFYIIFLVTSYMLWL